MRKKHQFVPGQVSAMEDRALMSGMRPLAAMYHGSSTLGYSGSLVLTTRAYNDAQNTVNVAIQQFTRATLNLFQKQGFSDTFYSRLGVGTYGTGPNDWSYGRGTALAGVDARVGSAEFRLPYGGGLGANNPTGGVGLSNRTALTSRNPGLDGTDGLSVAESLENAIMDATNGQELRANLEQVRVQTLAMGGTLRSYVSHFGPRGTGYFGTK